MPQKNNNLNICVLASGSKGNSIFISNSQTAILIDAGLSAIEIERRLISRNLHPEMLNAIIVSHEHSDHIRGVGILSRRYNLPIYITKPTVMVASKRLGKLQMVNYFECGCEFQLGSLKIHPFSLSHDAKDTAGFTIQDGHHKIGVATDLGIATSVVKQHLRNANILVIEANHDPEMLINGPYPWPLKQRVKGRMGHLSNEATMHLLEELMHDNLKHVVLAHLSETNNTPKKARDMISPIFEHTKTLLTVASQDMSTKVISS